MAAAANPWCGGEGEAPTRHQQSIAYPWHAHLSISIDLSIYRIIANESYLVESS